MDQKRHYGLGIDAQVTVCSWTTNVIMVWTHHCVLVDQKRHCGLGMDALITVCSWTRNVIMVSAWMHWPPCARGPHTSLWFGHGCTGHCVLVDQKRHYGLGMDALVTVCSWTTKFIMVRAWMHWSPPAKVLACVGLQVVSRGEFRTAKFTQDSHD